MEVDAWLARAAAARPQSMALETPGGDWSYARLHAAARFGAGELLARGARPGALPACWLRAAPAFPAAWRLAAGEQERLVEGARVVVREPLGEGPEPASL